MDLIRKLLLAIEQHPELNGVRQYTFDDPSDLGLTDVSAEAMGYHLTLLVEAGLVVGKPVYQNPVVSQLTWKGHDFADSIRDPVIWRQTKEGVAKAGGFSFELLSALAKGFLKKKIEELTGITVNV